jgi:hypothetical protein
MKTEDIVRYNQATEQEIKPGDRVYLKSLNQEAIVTSSSDLLVWVFYGDTNYVCLSKTEVTRLPEE